MWRQRIKDQSGSLSPDNISASKLTAVSSVATVDANRTIKDLAFSVGPGYLKKKTVTFLGVEGKESITRQNIAAIFIVAFFTVSSCSDIFSNVIYLLESDDYYHLKKDEAIKANSDASLYSAIPTVIMLIMSGFIFDIVGRRVTVTMLFALMTLSALMMPLVSPSIGWWTVSRALTQTCQVPLLSNPLVNDYASVESRTKGFALMNLGQISGQIVAFGVLFNITKSLKSSWAYYLAALWCLCGGALSAYLISEPKINTSKEDKRVKKMSLWTKIKSLIYMSCKCIGQDSTLFIGYPGIAIGFMSTIIIQVFYQEWMQFFVVSPECPDCPIANADDLKTLYTNQGLIGNCGALVLIMITSKLSEKVSPKILIPGTYIFRAFVLSLYLLCKDPGSWFGYVLILFLNGTGSCELVALTGYISKRFPKQNRGMMLSFSGLYAQAGISIYTEVGTWLIQTRSNPSWVFAGLALFDFIYFIVLVLSIMFKKFGDKEVVRNSDIPQVQIDNALRPDYSPMDGSTQVLLDHENQIDVAVVDEEDFEDGGVAPLRANIDKRSVKFNGDVSFERLNGTSASVSPTSKNSVNKDPRSILKSSTNSRDEIMKKSASLHMYPTSQLKIKIETNQQDQNDEPAVEVDQQTPPSPKFGEPQDVNYDAQNINASSNMPDQ